MTTITRAYQYSFGSWWGKLALWLVISLALAAMILDFPNSIFDIIEGTADTEDLLRVGGSALIVMLLCSYAVNLYPNVFVVDQGLLIDFYWAKRLIPWENIVAVVDTGGKASKSWAVEVSRLSLLHRMYGFFYLKSFSRPCFIIFSFMPEYGKLLEKINKEIKKRRPKPA